MEGREISLKKYILRSGNSSARNLPYTHLTNMEVYHSVKLNTTLHTHTYIIIMNLFK